MGSRDRAIWRYAEERFAALARKVRYRLQRIQASRIYGDDLGHKTVWDEYCYEVLRGPTEALESAWTSTLHPFLEQAVSALSNREKVLLFLATEEGLGFGDDAEGLAPADNDALSRSGTEPSPSVGRPAQRKALSAG